MTHDDQTGSSRKNKRSLFSDFLDVTTETWEGKIRGDLGEDALQKLSWTPWPGERVAPFYRADDLADLAHVPRSPSKTTGWALRQDVHASNLDAANQQIRNALNGGVDGIGLSPQLKQGMLSTTPLQSTQDAQRLFEGVSLSDCSWHLGGPAALPLLAFLYHEAERRNLSTSTLRGSVAFDPASLFAQTGTLRPKEAYSEIACLLSDEILSNFHLLAVNLAPYHAAGASPNLELALACATITEHLAQLTEAGCLPEGTLAHMHVEVEVGRDYFLEIAKLRALRILHKQVVHPFLEGTEGAPDPSDLYVQASTSRRAHTRYAPPMNMLRHTTEAHTAVIGGADVVRVQPHQYTDDDDTASFARRLARNTQHVLREEAHLGRVTDPAGGAYYVEVLTDKIARRAWTQFQEIEARGGLLATLRSGFIQQMIAATRRRMAKAVEAGEAPFVGTSLHPNPDEKHSASEPPLSSSSGVDLHTTDASYDANAPLASRCRALREGALLSDLLPAHTADPAIKPLPAGRWTEPFEQLRRRMERYAYARDDGAPEVLLLPWGNASTRSARADFARSFFVVAGFPVTETQAYATADDAAQAAASSSADLVVLCSSDDAYLEGASVVRRALRSNDSNALLVVAGAPQDEVDANAFIHQGSPLLKSLQHFQKQMGL